MQKINFYLNAQQVKRLENLNKLELDLSDVKVVDTEAIKFLMERAKNADVAIKNPPDVLWEILDILGIRDEFIARIKVI